ncbi:hypothetical protein [Lentzea sp. NPDC004782]|uniref:hypothetical protein n=1 Tax=Lentzea sp. NPDC004782 TaxID=3154458 RepID=UPI0033BBC25C
MDETEQIDDLWGKLLPSEVNALLSEGRRVVDRHLHRPSVYVEVRDQVNIDYDDIVRTAVYRRCPELRGFSGRCRGRQVWPHGRAAVQTARRRQPVVLVVAYRCHLPTYRVVAWQVRSGVRAGCAKRVADAPHHRGGRARMHSFACQSS